MEREPKPRLFRDEERQKRFLPPAVMLQEALQHIEPDGTVRMYDEIENSWYTVDPYPPAELETLTPREFALALGDVADAIHGAILQEGIASRSFRAKQLATFLTAYHHAPVFIEYACSLVGYDADEDALTGVELPEGYAHEWAPRLQAKLLPPKKA